MSSGESNTSEPEAAYNEYWRVLTSPPLVWLANTPTPAEVKEHRNQPYWIHDNVRIVTAKMRTAAARKLGALLVMHEGARVVIARHHPAQLSDPKALVDAIREDADSRYELALHFNVMLRERLDSMPDRVRQNGMKELNHGIYPPHDWLPSQDYSVLLALAMIDGTFDEDASQLDSIDVENKQGTHRAAAQIILA